MKTSILNVTGMGCSGCANSVESALNSLKGVDSASVNLEQATASVTFDESQVQPADFEKAIEEVGYTMTGVKS